MLRTSFALILIAIGMYYALQSPFFGLLLYIALAYFRPEDWVWHSTLLLSLNLSFLVGIYVTLTTIFSGNQLVWNGRIALLFIFLFHTFISTIFSGHFADIWTPWVNFLKTIVITYLLNVLIVDFRRFRLTVLVMVFALGLLNAKQGWVYIVNPPDWENENSVPFLGDNNGVAVGMLMLAPLTAFLAQTTENKRMRPFYWVTFIGVLNRALSTHSRGGFLAFTVLVGISILRSRRKVPMLLGCLLAAAIILPSLPETFWNRMSTIETYEETQDNSALSRLHFWSVALQMANTNPMLGVGYMGYNSSYNAYDFSQGQYGKNRSAHSSYFGTLAELGYLGALLYGVILLGALRACHRVRKLSIQNLIPSEVGKAAAALELSLVAFMVGGSFVPFQYNEMLWHIIGLTIVIERLATEQMKRIKTAAPLEVQKQALSAA